MNRWYANHVTVKIIKFTARKNSIYAKRENQVSIIYDERKDGDSYVTFTKTIFQATWNGCHQQKLSFLHCLDNFPSIVNIIDANANRLICDAHHQLD